MQSPYGPPMVSFYSNCSLILNITHVVEVDHDVRVMRVTYSMLSSQANLKC